MPFLRQKKPSIHPSVHPESPGHLDVVCFLLHLGASINIATKDVASTPLHLAATGGHVEMVRVMLANGAEILGVEKFIYTSKNSQTKSNSSQCEQ